MQAHAGDLPKSAKWGGSGKGNECVNGDTNSMAARRRPLLRAPWPSGPDPLHSKSIWKNAGDTQGTDFSSQQYPKYPLFVRDWNLSFCKGFEECRWSCPVLPSLNR